MREMSHHQQQQQQIHQLELHLQQQHIQHHQAQILPHSQQQSLQPLHPLQQRQQQQQPQHFFQPAPTLAAPATSSSTHQLHLQMHQAAASNNTQQNPQAIYYTQHYYPSPQQFVDYNTDSHPHHHPNPHQPSLSPTGHSHKDYTTLVGSNLSADQQHHQLTGAGAISTSRSDYQHHPFDSPYCNSSGSSPYLQSPSTTTTTATAHSAVINLSAPSTWNPTIHHPHDPTALNSNQLSNKQINNITYKPRNSAVFRHQSFQPFYANINNNSYHLNQRHHQHLQQQQQPLQSHRQPNQAAPMSSLAPETPISGCDVGQGAGTVTAIPKLIWLLFMHRHGDRTPLNMAPRDKYNNVMYWPEGFGNLDNAGRQRMYKLGKFIRRRYEDFLTDNIREVYSRSSDVDRCIESSHAVLAGLYPPSDRFEWNKDLRWVPAPVHTVPAPEDYLLNEAGRKFLVDVINEIQLIQKSDAVKKLYADSVKERELMERELGYEYDVFWKFKATYSTLDIEERNGLEMPAWYTPELKEKLYRFAGIAFGLCGGGTEKLKKLRCGHLLNDIVSRMELAPIEGPKMRNQSDFMQPTNAPTGVDDRRIVHYSTHDSIMAAFLEALNINTPMPIPPGFGATFFVELYVDLDEQGLPVSEKYIKLFYMDDTDSEKPIEKKLPNCKLNQKGQLTLENFKSYIANLISGSSSSSNTCNL